MLCPLSGRMPEELVIETRPDDAVQILAPDGTVVDPDARKSLDLADEDLRGMYRAMLVTRQVDVEATALQRQGELAVYPPLLGQEAAQIGSAYALGEEDFVFPSYREVGVAVVRGIDLVEYMHFHRGTRHGGIEDPLGSRFAEISVPVSSQVLHAVGWALGARLDGKDACAVVYFGDGATSQGDFHEGCNVAGVLRCPVVFFCQNNQWAISVPVQKQTAAPIWKKAEAYGFPGVRVDGNDVLAVYKVSREAVARAREERIPTLIEAVTYRIGAHSTADDATRYRDREDVDAWQAFDPVERFRGLLESEGLLDQEFVDGVQADAKAEAARVRAGIQGAPPRPLEGFFDHVFAEMPEFLARQRDEVARLTGEEGAEDA
jgi:2-oxoisovalerate dehydrogenase E1 component alpha subunit